MDGRRCEQLTSTPECRPGVVVLMTGAALRPGDVPGTGVEGQMRVSVVNLWRYAGRVEYVMDEFVLQGRETHLGCRVVQGARISPYHGCPRVGQVAALQNCRADQVVHEDEQRPGRRDADARRYVNVDALKPFDGRATISSHRGCISHLQSAHRMVRSEEHTSELQS